MFFGSYIAALEITATYDHVPALVFAWERHIPFWAWTVVPYWSEDLFYALSLFVCTSRAELDTHALRLVLAQAIAIPIFLLFPLRLTSTLPADQGIFTPWFDALGDVVGKPFNLAPSLHIAIVLILGALYIRHVPWPWRGLVYGWGFLIGLSTLTAYQHHFFDVPTGAMLGFACIWALPFERPSPLKETSWRGGSRRMRLAGLYGGGGLALTALAAGIGGTAWWLLWPAQSVLLVAATYALLGPEAFAKGRDGRRSVPARWLLGPYLLGARASAAWLGRGTAAAEVAPGVWLGRVVEGDRADAVLDLTAEQPAGTHGDWTCVPMLDLVAPEPGQLVEAVAVVEEKVAAGRSLLVACALGLSRSAAVVATWLVDTGRADDVDDAIARIRAVRPGVVLHHDHRQAIERALQLESA
jgi:hypothetical protein